jgi:hypothetical protein
MNIALTYRDTVTKMIWVVAGMTALSVMLKSAGMSGCRYINQEEFVLMTNTGRLVRA